MPRTVEHIVACHREATALRAAGKPIWNRKINVRGIIQESPDDESPAHVASISVRIGKLLRSSLPPSFFDITSDDFDFDFDFVDVIENLEECTVESLAGDKEAIGIEAVDMFNEWMEELYDWADRNRVWLGA